MNAIGKKASGKQVSTTYIKIEEVGNAQTTDIYKGREFSIDELKKMADTI